MMESNTRLWSGNRSARHFLPVCDTRLFPPAPDKTGLVPGPCGEGIPTPDALALVEYRSGLLSKRSLLFTRYVDGARELNEYVLSRYGGALSPATRQQKKRFIQALAELIRDMHAKGIYHADMKSNNILVREDGDAWKLFIIDLDRVRIRKSLSFTQRANNLAQINASVAACITPADRILFFRHYAKGRLPAWRQKNTSGGLWPSAETKTPAVRAGV